MSSREFYIFNLSLTWVKSGLGGELNCKILSAANLLIFTVFFVPSILAYNLIKGKNVIFVRKQSSCRQTRRETATEVHIFIYFFFLQVGKLLFHRKFSSKPETVTFPETTTTRNVWERLWVAQKKKTISFDVCIPRS